MTWGAAAGSTPSATRFSRRARKTFYFGPGGDSGAPSQNDGTLTRRPPSAASGSDPVLYTGISSPCTLTTEQYSLGAAAILLGSTGNPCVQDDTTNQFGPGSLTYTSAPFEQPATIAGPITASIFATSTRPEVELVATVDDISPSGRSRPLSSGALLGSFRAVEDRRTWNSTNGSRHCFRTTPTPGHLPRRFPQVVRSLASTSRYSQFSPRSRPATPAGDDHDVGYSTPAAKPDPIRRSTRRRLRRAAKRRTRLVHQPAPGAGGAPLGTVRDLWRGAGPRRLTGLRTAPGARASGVHLETNPGHR